MPEYMTSKDVLHRLQISPMTLWRYETDPTANFPKPMRLGRIKRYRRADVEQWEASKQLETA
jgi:predicted DNA-binding transcriptional regulator AlpA